MHLLEVKTHRDCKRFVSFPVDLYKNQKQYIRPLDKDIADIFDPAVNKNFERGSCVRWLLLNDNKIIGRIAAFVLKKTSLKGGAENFGGVGFFECINDQNAANALFDISKNWLVDQSIEFMDGPINFGARDKWWGLLTKGFDLEPNYQCNYNFPYYRELFENYGFQTYFEHYTFLKAIK